jgi:hypothetical protein
VTSEQKRQGLGVRDRVSAAAFKVAAGFSLRQRKIARIHPEASARL